jgi:hypothetical protein
MALVVSFAGDLLPEAGLVLGSGGRNTLSQERPRALNKRE